ncbi:MAG: hypothetical protein IPJ40_18960 [Saprospirales bacterium]|nr:hypothetical protein [Saprospirales bacterium]
MGDCQVDDADEEGKVHHERNIIHPKAGYFFDHQTIEKRMAAICSAPK